MDGGAWWAAVHRVVTSRTRLSDFSFTHWRRKWQPLQCSCSENPRDRGAWWAAVYGVAQGRTRLKRLSSSSSRVTRIVPSSPTSVVTNSDHSPPRGEREVTRAEKVRENGDWLAIDRSPRGSGMATFYKELRCLIFKLIPCVHSGLHLSNLSSLAP